MYLCVLIYIRRPCYIANVSQYLSLYKNYKYIIINKRIR
jgi:hypothetical protein